MFRALAFSFVGPRAVRMIESYRADGTFFSVKRLTLDGLLAEADPLETGIRRAMIFQAADPVLPVDGRELERQGTGVMGTFPRCPGHDRRRPRSSVKALESLGVVLSV